MTVNQTQVPLARIATLPASRIVSVHCLAICEINIVLLPTSILSRATWSWLASTANRDNVAKYSGGIRLTSNQLSVS